MNNLTNSVRDVSYLNDEIHHATDSLIKELKIIEDKFIQLNQSNPNLIDDYLEYMSYKDEEDMFNIGINKYFDEGTEQYNQYKKDLSILKRKLIYPKFKLQHFVSSIDKYKFL